MESLQATHQTKLVFEVAVDEQESIRSWVSKGGLSWCDKCNVPISHHNRCRSCGAETRPIDTRLRGETRPIFPGERLVQGLTDIVPEDAWLVVTDNTDLAYNVLINGRVVGDLVFEKGWKVKISARALHAALYFPPQVEVSELALGHVLYHRQIRETWVKALSSVNANEYIVYSCGKWHGLAKALINLSPEDLAGAGFALQILSADQKSENGAQEEPLRFETGYQLMRTNWRFSQLPKGFRERMQRALDANFTTIEMMERRALDRIDEAVKANLGTPISVSFSGGKDSALVAELLRQYHDQRNPSIKVYALFADTSIEFPETYAYVKEFFAEPRYGGIFELRWKRPVREFFDLWNDYGPPSRYARWCCGTQKLSNINAILDEFGSQVLVCNGIRADESVSRSRRTIVDTNPYVEKQIIIQPILDWGLLDVWLYIFWRDVLMSPLYLMGFNRTGCYPCPYSSNSMLATLEKTHPELMAKLQRKFHEFSIEDDFRFRISPNLDESLKTFETTGGKSQPDLRVQNLCGGGYYVYQNAPLLLDMDRVAKELADNFHVQKATSMMVMVDLSAQKSVHLTRSGRMMVMGVQNHEEVREIYKTIMSFLTRSNGRVRCAGCEMRPEKTKMSQGDGNGF